MFYILHFLFGGLNSEPPDYESHKVTFRRFKSGLKINDLQKCDFL